MQRQDLDKLTTKQAYLRPLVLTSNQEAELEEQTRYERQLFKNSRQLTTADLQKLTKIEASEAVYLAKTVENPYLTPAMSKIFYEIANRFKQKLPGGYFIIVSLSRTFEDELKTNKLIAQTDTHSKGEAVDIAAKFMKKYFSDVYQALFDILSEMQKDGKIIFLNEEDSTTFWHIVRNPEYKG